MRVDIDSNNHPIPDVIGNDKARADITMTLLSDILARDLLSFINDSKTYGAYEFRYVLTYSRSVTHWRSAVGRVISRRLPYGTSRVRVYGRYIF